LARYKKELKEAKKELEDLKKVKLIPKNKEKDFQTILDSIVREYYERVGLELSWTPPEPTYGNQGRDCQRRMIYVHPPTSSFSKLKFGTTVQVTNVVSIYSLGSFINSGMDNAVSAFRMFF
jgi:hypothetical protein